MDAETKMRSVAELEQQRKKAEEEENFRRCGGILAENITFPNGNTSLALSLPRQLVRASLLLLLLCRNMGCHLHRDAFVSFHISHGVMWRGSTQTVPRTGSWC